MQQQVLSTDRYITAICNKKSHNKTMSQTQKIQQRSQAYQQLHSLDDYGYPQPPDSRQRLRKTTIRASKGLLNICLFLIMSIVGSILRLGRIGKNYPPLAQHKQYPRRILVIRLDLIGDLVLSMTTIRALKHTYPDAMIDLLALPTSATVVTGDPDLNEIITYDPNVWRRPRALVHPKTGVMHITY